MVSSSQTGPDAENAGAGEGPTPWKLPPYIWHENARRSWLEAAERCFTEGFEQGCREGLAQSIILRLFYWRGIDVPDTVRKRVRASRDLGELERWRVRAYEMRDPEELFCSDG